MADCATGGAFAAWHRFTGGDPHRQVFHLIQQRFGPEFFAILAFMKLSGDGQSVLGRSNHFGQCLLKGMWHDCGNMNGRMSNNAALCIMIQNRFEVALFSLSEECAPTENLATVLMSGIRSS